MYRFLVVVLAVGVLSFGCETELQKRYREAAEEEERMDQEFLEELNKVKADAARADLTDGKSIILIINKIRELEADARGVDPNLQEEYKNTKIRWNNNYLRLGKAKYNEVVSAANKMVDIQEYESAIAEMNKFPEELKELGPFEEMVDKYKEAIKAFARAPAEAHETVREADELVKAKEYEKALERCDRYFKTTGRTRSPAVYIVINRHISILEQIIDEMTEKGEYDKALERIQYFMNVYGVGSTAHKDFLNEKAEEIDKKKAAGK